MEKRTEADADYYAEEIAWRRDTRAFVFGLLKYWLWWTGTTIAGGIAAVWQGGGHVIPGWIISSVAMSGLVIASFLTFRDQRRIAESKGMELIRENRNRELEQNSWILKTKDFDAQITSLKSQLDDREKRKQARKDLSVFLDRLERRITEIHQMSPYRYIESIDDMSTDDYIPTISDYERKERIKNLNDKSSVALLTEISNYLESLEEGKGTLFLSHTGIECSARNESDDIWGAQANKKAIILDHLNHRSKNLKKMIEALGW